MITNLCKLDKLLFWKKCQRQSWHDNSVGKKQMNDIPLTTDS